MKKQLANLIGKKFSVYVGGEFERMTDFIGFMKLLANWSDFFEYTKQEKQIAFSDLLNTKILSIDSNIFVKIGK
ncbi:MAG TPA: hypothetical protein VMR41_06300 [Patescibacteria group bacterium]|nr:hypothetical protein [Patescibacteria group bacterium]